MLNSAISLLVVEVESPRNRALAARAGAPFNTLDDLDPPTPVTHQDSLHVVCVRKTTSNLLAQEVLNAGSYDIVRCLLPDTEHPPLTNCGLFDTTVGSLRKTAPFSSYNELKMLLSYCVDEDAVTPIGICYLSESLVRITDSSGWSRRVPKVVTNPSVNQGAKPLHDQDRLLFIGITEKAVHNCLAKVSVPRQPPLTREP